MSDRADARADRLKAALRENLKRRKVQVRGREADASPEPAEDADAQTDRDAPPTDDVEPRPLSDKTRL